MTNYGKYKNKTYSLRMDNETREKMAIIAKCENRYLSQEIELACKIHVKEYEEKNGKIM